ncbi:MAG: hydantoinase B/oxoprolinase family protein [Xanthobacteraceae bacterium]
MTAIIDTAHAQDTAAAPIDPVTVEVIRRRLVAIADEVDTNITRTAFSPYIYEYKDYAVGIVDANGDLICQCTAGMPVFVADVMRAAVQDGLELYGRDELFEGDIIVTNYAGTIGQHLNNVTMYTPIHAAKHGEPLGELLGFMVVVMHWIDVGGRDVGSISKFATDIFQEGIQFRTVKLQSRGEKVREMYRMIEHNTRFPVEMMGDINSQIGGCLLGRDSVAELAGRFGTDTFRRAIIMIWNQSEAEARAAIAAVPNGTYTAEATLDNDGLNPDPLPCKVTVIIKGDEMTIDLSALPREVNAPMNSGRSGGGSTVARLAFRYLLLPEGDANEGTFRPLKLILPEGTIVSANPTAPMGSYNSALPMLIDLVIRALGSAMPDRVAAAHYGTFSTLAYAGRHPDTGAFWQCHDSGFGGWGALHDMDGPGPFRTMCHGDTRLIPIELHEASYPFMFESFSLRTDSGGAGEFRGGLGLERRYLMLAPARISTRIERTLSPAWGLNGGGEGKPGAAIIERADGTTQNALKDVVMLRDGDRVRTHTGGGGGFGDPKRRDLERLRTDLRRGYISAEAARDVYGLEN